MSLPWFRMYADILTDWRVESLSIEDQRHFVFLLAAKCAGYIDENYPSEEVRDRAIASRIALRNENVTVTKRALQAVGLIDENWQPVAWERRQKPSDSAAERMRKYRENKAKSKSVTERAKPLRNGDALDRDRDKDISTSLRSVDAAPPKRKARLPDDFALTEAMHDELLRHAPAANPAVEFAQFCDHHRAHGTTMLDWPAAWRTWCRNAVKFNRGTTHGPRSGGGAPSAVERVRAATGQ